MRRFPLPPIHRSTLILAVLVFVLGIAANFGGDYHPPEFGESTARISFGWPWAYGDWEGYSTEFNKHRRSPWTFWRVDYVDVWYPFAFVENLLALLLIVTSLAALWEWRRRKVKHLWQFTLADILLGSLAIMAFYGVERWLCRDVFAEREFRLTLDNPMMFDEVGQSLGVAERRFSDNQDVPADWFWELFSIPETHRPYRRLALHLGRSLDEGPKQLTARQLELLGRCRGLREFSCYGFTVDDVRPLKSWSQLRLLELIQVSDTQLRGLPSMPQLQSIGFCEGEVSDNGVRELHRQTKLRSLQLEHCPKVTGSGFTSLTTVEELDLNQLALNNQGLVALGEMPKLLSIHLELLIDPDNPQPLDWRPLGKARNLQRITIAGNSPYRGSDTPIVHEINDDGLAAIATLPQLSQLSVRSTLITDEGVRSLGAATSIHHLRIDSRHGLLTDATLDFFAEMKRPSYLTIIGEAFSKEAIQRLLTTDPHANVLR